MNRKVGRVGEESTGRGDGQGTGDVTVDVLHQQNILNSWIIEGSIVQLSNNRISRPTFALLNTCHRFGIQCRATVADSLL